MNWDLTDVPAIASADLAAAMQALIADGRGLVLLRGLEDADLDTVQAELKRRFHADPQTALAVFVRFRHLAEVFSARRLKELMLERGFALIGPAIAIAASLRLNANRGFNPQKFLIALQDAQTDNVVPMPTRERALPESELLAA
ncbi:MAG: hypothetical protein ACXWJH_03195 [Hyphomicrobium sp.]